MNKVICMWNAGLGNIIEATPMAVALESIGYTPKIVLNANWPDVDKLIPWECYSSNDVNLTDCKAFALGWWARNMKFPPKLPDGTDCPTYYPRIVADECGEIEANVDVARQLGYNGETPNPRILVPDIDNPLLYENYIVISPGYQHATKHANWSNKHYPHWGEVIDLLNKKYKTVVVGLQEDYDKELYKNTTMNMCGKTNLIQMARIISGASGVISIDNGPAHIADAYSVPTLVLFGPTSTHKNSYPNAKKIFMPYDEVRCRPCQHDIAKMSNCKNNRCMSMIDPQQIVDEVYKLMENK